MKKHILLLTLAFAAIVTSCKEEKEATQMKEVIAVHDEVMPKMGQLGQLVGKLKERENDSTDLGKEYREARIDLQEANQAMMDWMQNFGDRFSPDEIMKGKELSPEKQEWLDEEEEKVKALREQINSSIENAQEVLAVDNDTTS
ncbi:hypothetical protein RQM65_07605 [Pricia sp. S334]|uniref:Viral A-type inclusion protein n=1 Tax=Pricia mediterranea TaxID=3076079 RepID=A0ABU3L469_9FLAO|nr:hypothetical protein [Pricia sp. S334]MDT7828524.1 hypothetical protein [Pricia sp. S334]